MPELIPTLNDLKTYAEELARTLLNLKESVDAQQRALSELLPGFKDSYQKHLAALVEKKVDRTAVLVRLHISLEGLLRSIQELYDARGSE